MGLRQSEIVILQPAFSSEVYEEEEGNMNAANSSVLTTEGPAPVSRVGESLVVLLMARAESTI
eukprot:scaffold36639_cov32-Tisochrysis_lutea.AAC.2